MDTEIFLQRILQGVFAFDFIHLTVYLFAFAAIRRNIKLRRRRHKAMNHPQTPDELDNCFNISQTCSTPQPLSCELPETKAAEHSKSLEEYKAIFDSVPLGLAYLDTDFNILKMNRFLYDFNGLKPEDVIGRPCFNTIGEFAADNSKCGTANVCSYCKTAEALMTGRQTFTERPIGERFAKITTIPQFNSNNSINHFLEVVEDITWQKEAEEFIVRHYQVQGTINSILRISIEPISLTDALQQVLELVLSIPRFSFQSKGSIHLMDDEAQTLVLCARHNYTEAQVTTCGTLALGNCLCGLAAATGEVVYSETLDDRHTISYDGRVPHGNYCIPIVNDNKVLGVLNVSIPEGHKRSAAEEDLLTAIANTLSGVIVRKRSNARVIESEEHFRSVVESTRNAIVTVNSRGFITFWNNAAEDIFGFTFDEVRGMPLTKIIPERFQKDHMAAISKVLKAGKARVIGETTEIYGLRKDGNEFPVEFSVARWEASTGAFYTAILVDITTRKQTEECLAKSFDNLRKAVGGIINTLTMAVEVKDPYTAGHQKRVADIARKIATEMGLSKEQIEGVRMAGSIHDLGKIWVPSEILSKPGRLHDSEFTLIKNHSNVGFDILKTIDFLWPIDQMVLQHHERLDGSGYPQGLKGDNILIEARIICVADIVEAMSSHRPYRASLGMDIAMNEIVSNKGILYDPDVVDACLNIA
ncbi:MAG: PAS domain S-box protein [Nitrospirota bacterium]